jgi:hypothetical protein
MSSAAVWISRHIFECEVISSTGNSISKDLWRRAYEIWEHSRGLIENSKDDFNLVDGITNLKRSLNQRLKLIEDLYHLKTINFVNKPIGYLETLENYGLVRPFIVKNLFDVRNDIEHNDAIPPSKEKCREWLDVVWYFLKSTDSIVQIQKQDIEFSIQYENKLKTNYWFSADINSESHTPVNLHGWFPFEFISLEPRDGFFKMNAIEFTDSVKFNERNRQNQRFDTDKWVRGEASLSGEDLKALLKEVFITY